MGSPMKIGITFDLRQEDLKGPDLPDDSQEEFDSPRTIEAIARVLRDLGHEVVHLGDGREMVQRVLPNPPDFVFNIAEGEGIGRSREARVPAVLEMLGIPYTGSDPLTLAATLDKDCAKRLVASAGVTVPRGIVLRENEPAAVDSQSSIRDLPFPVIVKPAWEGSSKGIRHRCLVDRPEQLAEVVEAVRRDHRQPVLIEEFIQGEELTVGVLGNDPPRVLGIMRVVPLQGTKRFVYSLEVKRQWEDKVRYECPARLPLQVLEAVEKAALASYRVLGCRDVARVDFRVREGVPYFLEVNPLPGLNPDYSDLVIMAKAVGWSYSQLIETILDSALKRHRDSMR